MHAKVFSIQIFQHFHQIPPRVCTLVLFIIIIITIIIIIVAVVVIIVIIILKNCKTSKRCQVVAIDEFT